MPPELFVSRWDGTTAGASPAAGATSCVTCLFSSLDLFYSDSQTAASAAVRTDAIDGFSDMAGGHSFRKKEAHAVQDLPQDLRFPEALRLTCAWVRPVRRRLRNISPFSECINRVSKP